MGNKSALKYSNVSSNDNTTNPGSPFWADKTTNRKIKVKFVFKQI